MLPVPDLAGVANREIRRDLRARVGLVGGAKEATPTGSATAGATPTGSATAGTATAGSASTAASPAAAPASSATTATSASRAGGEGRRGERETNNHQSRAERRNETAAPLAIGWKTSVHR
jgi:hypothetical protein